MVTIVPAQIIHNDRSLIVTWPNLAASDVGAGVRYPGWHLDCVQMTGTFNLGFVTMQGSLNGVIYNDMKHQASSTVISSNSSGLFYPAGTPTFVRPIAGALVASVTVMAVFLRR